MDIKHEEKKKEKKNLVVSILMPKTDTIRE